MSADAFAVSVGKGAGLNKPRLRDALHTGVIFGIVEAITPIIGWLMGVAASRYIASIDHWLAFAILALVGGKLIYEALGKEEDAEEEARRRPRLMMCILTAIGTSIDALAVGVTLAFVDNNIWLTAAAIGGATCLMVTIGIMTGHYIGRIAGKFAEIAGGVCLIAIGTHILLQHLRIIGG